MVWRLCSMCMCAYVLHVKNSILLVRSIDMTLSRCIVHALPRLSTMRVDVDSFSIVSATSLCIISFLFCCVFLPLSLFCVIIVIIFHLIPDCIIKNDNEIVMHSTENLHFCFIFTWYTLRNQTHTLTHAQSKQSQL